MAIERAIVRAREATVIGVVARRNAVVAACGIAGMPRLGTRQVATICVATLSAISVVRTTVHPNWAIHGVAATAARRNEHSGF